MEFQLKSEFIELDNLLKNLNFVASGAEAKQFILTGSVKVNGQVEIRIRRKLRAGDFVEFQDKKIDIAAIRSA
jgi:ribosome-associated protein